jgi:hypothetical protein
MLHSTQRFCKYLISKAGKSLLKAQVRIFVSLYIDFVLTLPLSISLTFLLFHFALQYQSEALKKRYSTYDLLLYGDGFVTSLVPENPDAEQLERLEFE